MITKQEAPYKKVIQTGGVIMMSGILALLTGCGSPSGSTGPTSSTNAGGTGLSTTQANASATDIALLKEANGKLGVSSDQASPPPPPPPPSEVKIPGSVFAEEGVVDITFKHPKLTDYAVSKGLRNVSYLSRYTYQSTFRFGSDSDSVQFDGTSYRLNQSGSMYYDVYVPQAGESCQDCYFSFFKQTVGGLSSQIVNYKSGTQEYAAIQEIESVAANHEIMTLRFFETKESGFTLSLAPDGSVIVSTIKENETSLVEQFGPFKLSINGSTYTLVSKLALPISTQNEPILVFKLFNSSGLHIGEATYDSKNAAKFLFKLYVNGVLTPVDNL